MNVSFRTVATSAAKLAVSGAVICAIAWSFLIFDSPQGDVSKADADIFSLDVFAPHSENQRFMTILRDRGMEQPRSYNWNGNTLYYSMGSTDASPHEFLLDFQQELVEKGINKQAHTRLLPAMSDSVSTSGMEAMRDPALKKSATEHLERTNDFFSGGLVPIQISRDRVAMAGAISKDEADDAHGFLAEMVEGRQALSETVGAMRYVEAWRAPGDKKTTIASLWSDDELDMAKFAPDAKRSDMAVDQEIPVCLGCRRLMRFGGEGDEREYATNVFVGQQSVAQVVGFYDQALQRRGWKMAPSSRTLRMLRHKGIASRSNAQMTSFARGARFITVMAYPIDHGRATQVHVFRSP
jgi:hypothetical protein